MRKDGFNVILYLRNDGRQAVRFSKDDVVQGRESWQAHDLPLAINISALKARGVIE